MEKRKLKGGWKRGHGVNSVNNTHSQWPTRTPVSPHSYYHSVALLQAWAQGTVTGYVLSACDENTHTHTHRQTYLLPVLIPLAAETVLYTGGAHQLCREEGDIRWVLKPSLLWVIPVERMKHTSDDDTLLTALNPHIKCTWKAIQQCIVHCSHTVIEDKYHF